MTPLVSDLQIATKIDLPCMRQPGTACLSQKLPQVSHRSCAEMTNPGEVQSSPQSLQTMVHRGNFRLHCRFTQPMQQARAGAQVAAVSHLDSDIVACCC